MRRSSSRYRHRDPSCPRRTPGARHRVPRLRRSSSLGRCTRKPIRAPLRIVISSCFPNVPSRSSISRVVAARMDASVTCSGAQTGGACRCDFVVCVFRCGLNDRGSDPPSPCTSTRGAPVQIRAGKCRLLLADLAEKTGRAGEALEHAEEAARPARPARPMGDDPWIDVVERLSALAADTEACLGPSADASLRQRVAAMFARG